MSLNRASHSAQAVATNPEGPLLAPGDKITLIAPSYPVTPGQVNKAVELVKGLGFVPFVPDDLLGDDLLCANSDAKRLEYVKAAFADRQSKALWALRGGYGATRLMPELLAMPKPEHFQWLAGFSDITALHMLVNQRWGWPSVHMPVMAQWADDRLDEETVAGIGRLWRIGGYASPMPVAVNAAARHVAKVEQGARIIGGNLCLVLASLGTAWQVDAADSWLLLEEVDERGYRIDRMLTQLSQAGVFAKAKGVLLGDMNGGDEPDGGNKIEAVLQRFALDAAFPVFRLNGVGHRRTNLPIILGLPSA